MVFMSIRACPKIGAWELDLFDQWVPWRCATLFYTCLRENVTCVCASPSTKSIVLWRSLQASQFARLVISFCYSLLFISRNVFVQSVPMQARRRLLASHIVIVVCFAVAKRNPPKRQCWLSHDKQSPFSCCLATFDEHCFQN
jgi:hypothetical protein